MHILSQWIDGELSSTARVWWALAPALVMSAYFLLGLCVYAVRSAVHGAYFDAEVAARDATVLTGKWVRHYFVWLMQPLWTVVLRTAVPATAITTLSVLLALASGVSLAAGRFALGGWLYILSGICDYLDGRIARSRGTSTAAGGALDSILDRYSDSATMVGLAWYYRDSWVLAAVLVALVGGSLVPYIRAKGEAAAIKMTVGFMQRAERVVYLGVPMALSPIVEVLVAPDDPKPLHRLAVAGIVLLAISTQITALQRLVHLLRALSDEPIDTVIQTAAQKRRMLLRNIVTAVVATAVDFAVVWIIVGAQTVSVPIATALGCAVGAVVNFTLNRVWTFGSNGKKMPQIWRYSFVSGTSTALNAGGVGVFLLLPGVDYRIAWVLVRAAVFLAWNYPLHRDYVFVQSETAC